MPDRTEISSALTCMFDFSLMFVVFDNDFLIIIVNSTKECSTFEKKYPMCRTDFKDRNLMFKKFDFDIFDHFSLA